ncbi:MAG: YIP1 family protein [candidate division Zixibacteria bacterium]|nr:YIP1 family protein [candidate division Zixibacteria bacterium]
MADDMHREPVIVAMGGSTKPEPALSWKGLWRVITTPAELFVKLREYPRVLIALLAAVVVFCIYILLVLDKMIALQMTEMTNANPGLDPNLIPKGVLELTTFIFGSLTIIAIPLITAVFAIFCGNFIFGGKASFKQVLSVAAYVNIIYMVGLLATVPLVLATDSMAVSYSLAAFFPELPIKSVAYVALSKVGVFYIWEFVVAAIGFSTMYEFPRSRGYIIAALSVGLMSLLHVAFTALGSLIQVGVNTGG